MQSAQFTTATDNLLGMMRSLLHSTGQYDEVASFAAKIEAASVEVWNIAPTRSNEMTDALASLRRAGESVQGNMVDPAEAVSQIGAALGHLARLR